MKISKVVLIEHVQKPYTGDGSVPSIKYCTPAPCVFGLGALLFVLLLTGCGSLPQPHPIAAADAAESVQLPFMGSEVVRVSFPKDGVVCYIAVEQRTLKSINCVLVDKPTPEAAQ